MKTGVPKTTGKKDIEVTLNIKPVKLAELTPRQRQLVKQFWTRLIAECQRELEAGKPKGNGGKR